MVDRGVNVIGTFRNNEPGASQLVEEAGKRGGKVVVFHLDLNSMESIRTLRDSVLTTLSQEWQTDKFDYLADNAGMSIMANFPDTSEDAFDEMNRVLFKGHFFMTQTSFRLSKTVVLSSTSRVLRPSRPAFLPVFLPMPP